MLLDLPPEILEMVLMELQPDSFSLILMTCKSIRLTVLASSKLLRAQLMKIPGLRLPDSLDHRHMLATLAQRAAEEGWNGIDVLTDITVHRPLNSALPVAKRVGGVSEQWTRPRVNLVQRCCKKGCENGVLVTAVDAEGAVHVYKIRGGTIRPFCVFDPRNMDLDDGDVRRVKYDCIAMRWQRCNSGHLDHLVGLFRYSIDRFTSERSGEFAKRFIKEAADRAERTLKLCVW